MKSLLVAKATMLLLRFYLTSFIIASQAIVTFCSAVYC